ncbi:MAG: cupin domain-containing protein [Cyanobacteria bacterium J06623_7]
MMQLNNDFTQRVVVHGTQLPWQPSPIAGVERRMFDRLGDEVARATSIVRYAANSQFSPHVHGAGEEFLVLEGVFQDEHGDYPVGSYVRNPPTSSHTPSSQLGCVIFVKLRQFDLGDRTEVRLNINDPAVTWKTDDLGAKVITLFQDEREEVRVEQWSANTTIEIEAAGGAELLVLSGSLTESEDELTTYSWLRVPINSQIIARTGAQGAKVWLKTGHIATMNPEE